VCPMRRQAAPAFGLGRTDSCGSIAGERWGRRDDAREGIQPEGARHRAFRILVLSCDSCGR
jgi:hypothetical protein